MDFTYIWIIIALLSLFLELGHPGLLFFLPISLAAATAACIEFFAASTVLAIIAFLMLSVLFTVLCRYWINTNKNGNKTGKESNIDALIGSYAIVTEDIAPGKLGRAKIHGEYWLAKSYDGSPIAEGTHVIVHNVIGAHLVVTKKTEGYIP